MLEPELYPRGARHGVLQAGPGTPLADSNSPGRAGPGARPEPAGTPAPTWSRRGLRASEVRAVKYCSSSESESSWLQ